MPDLDSTYKKLVVDIGFTLSKARENALRVINQELVKANWEIGRQIVEFEQHCNEKAEYGSALLTRLSKDLKSLMVKALEKAISRFTFNIFASLAEFEREIISEKTRAGLAAARARGRKGGRPPDYSKEFISKIKAVKILYGSTR